MFLFAVLISRGQSFLTFAPEVKSFGSLLLALLALQLGFEVPAEELGVEDERGPLGMAPVAAPE